MELTKPNQIQIRLFGLDWFKEDQTDLVIQHSSVTVLGQRDYMFKKYVFHPFASSLLAGGAFWKNLCWNLVTVLCLLRFSFLYPTRTQTQYFLPKPSLQNQSHPS